MKTKIALLLGLLLFTGKVAFAQNLSSVADSPVFDSTPFDVKPVTQLAPGQSLTTYHYFRSVDEGFGDIATTDITGSARASYGDVGASVTASVDPYDLTSDEGNGFLVGADASSDDYITVTSPTVANRTKGTFKINMFIEGTGISNNADVLPEIDFRLRSNVTTVLTASGPGGYESAAIPFTYGTPFEVFMSLSVDLRMENKNQDPTLPDIEANVGFLNSAIWDGEVVQDASGNLVTDASVMGSSNTVYPLAVPEPGATTLAVLGAGGLFVGLRRGVRRA